MVPGSRTEYLCSFRRRAWQPTGDGGLPLEVTNVPMGTVGGALSYARPSFRSDAKQPLKTILFLGAGFVAKPCLRYLLRREETRVTLGK